MSVHVPGANALIARPTLDYAVVCDDVRYEVGDKISLMGVFDAIQIQSFPAVHPRLSVVVAWMNVPGEVKSEIQLADPDGSLIGRLGVAHIQQKGARKGARHIAVSLNVPFKAPGNYQIKISLDGELIRSILLPVGSNETPKPGFSRLGGKLSEMG
jgi:hypothetical protein